MFFKQTSFTKKSFEQVIESFFKLTSFTQTSKQKSSFEHFFPVGSGTVELVDLSEDADEIVTVTESPDGKSSVVKTTFTFNDGNVKTFMAVQTLDENGNCVFEETFSMQFNTHVGFVK